MTTPSIEDRTAHNPIVLTDEAPITPISVRPTDRSAQSVSSTEPQNSLLQLVSNAGSSEQSELSVDTSTTRSFNDLKNFDPAQNYGSTDMSTTPSMTTPSIENGTAHNPIVLTDEAPTPISFWPTKPPATVERVRPIWQWNSKLVRIRCENSFWINLIL